MTEPTNPPGMPEPNPNPMVEVPYLELQDLRQRAIPQEELDYLRALPGRLAEMEQLASERNSFESQLADMTQERDRLKQLLLGIVPEMDRFEPGWPTASVARTAFQGETPEEIAGKMGDWEASRTQKSSEWNSLKNYVRIQASV